MDWDRGHVSPEVPEPEPAFDLLVANLAGGPVLRPTLDQARLAASSSLPTVICGETGTGKEGVSRAMHAWSGRKGPFVAVNCASLWRRWPRPSCLAIAKAPSRAPTAQAWHFRAAQGGTLLLDEVADLPEAVQAKLLRALEQREILPIGESVPCLIDVRVLAATQIPLAQLVASATFAPTYVHVLTA